MASGMEVRSIRWWSILASPMSSNGRSRSRSTASSTPILPSLTSASRRRRLSASIRYLEGLVHAARAVAFEVERHVHVAQRLQARDDFIALFNNNREIARVDLNP